jgi:hypothetical protein
MKIFFNGWFSGFLDNTNPGVHVTFFLELFQNVYNEDCDIGSLDESQVLCEFDMLLDCPGSYVKYKKWKQTYLFNGESNMRLNPNVYDIVLWGERNYKNIVNIPLFIPYIYSNNFVNTLLEDKTVTNVPANDVCVIVSNPRGIVRNKFLNALEKNFNIVYAGNYKNNIGGSLPYAYNTSNFLQFIGQFKFIISMENSRNDTYITEKIVHGLIANIIPVYWGSNRVCDYFNSERFLCLEDEKRISDTINSMKNIAKNPNKWLDIVNKPCFTNNKLERTYSDISKDIRCLINGGGWNHISHIHCVNNPIYEPERNIMLQNMFKKQNINSDFVKYISPTYKTTITQDIYNKYAKNQNVRHLRNSYLSSGELSLFLNYRAVLEDIEKNYKDGLFLIFESDAMTSKDIHKFNQFLDFIKDKEFDLIHLGQFDERLFNKPCLDNFITGYRVVSEKMNNDIIDYQTENTKKNVYIEDITNEQNNFRVIRKFYTRCTDSFLWKYSGIVKFLHFMRTFEDYSSPFDYYMCNYFEKTLNFKHYWSCDEFFIQGSNLGLLKSTLR